MIKSLTSPTLKLIDATKETPANDKTVLAVHKGRLLPARYYAPPEEPPFWVVQVDKRYHEVFFNISHWVRIPELCEFPEYKPELPKSEDKS